MGNEAIPKHAADHGPLGPDPINFGGGVYQFIVFDKEAPVVVGDEAFAPFQIPPDFDGMKLGAVEMHVATPSSSGIVRCQVRNITQALDMLTTRVQVDANEYSSKDAATAAVINDANATVAHGDRITIDVDDAGTGTLGLAVYLAFYTVPGFTLRGPQGTTGDTGAQGIQGEQGIQGDPGGITDWEGSWQASFSYEESDAVSHNGSSYVARQAHTSDTDDDEPGIGANWETYWMLLAEGAEAVEGLAADGWVAWDQPDDWVYVSPNSLIISGNHTEILSKGTRLMLMQTTLKFFVVVGSSFGGGSTTVTITGGDDYSLANAAITDNFYSYVANPQGYPGTFDWSASCNPTGFSSLTTEQVRFSVVGNVCLLDFFIDGTSNATTLTFTLPFAPSQLRRTPCRGTDNGALQLDVASLALSVSSTTADVAKTFQGTGWTASGNKAVIGTVSFEF